MLVDPRQVAAGCLTVYMFAMLGNMVKQDNFGAPPAGPTAPVSNARFEATPGAEDDDDADGPWQANSKKLTPCWTSPSSEGPEKSRGFVTFSLTNGPQYHDSQVAAAVVVARRLGAALVLPDIRGSEPGQKRKFEDVYDLGTFVRSLHGVIKVIEELPDELKAEEPAVLRVPSRVPPDYYIRNIEPVFRKKNYLRLAISSSPPMRSPKETRLNPRNELDSVICIATFGALRPNREIQSLASQMVERLKALGPKRGGRFVAADLRADAAEYQNECGPGPAAARGRKGCPGAREVGELLTAMGFGADTTIYITQTWWHEGHNILKQMFPKSYTKDDIMPAEMKGKFLRNIELERAIDIAICSRSDVFVVPASSGAFYETVVGRRIVSGRTQIYAPGGASSPSPADFNSSYVSKRSHMAYSCHC